MMACRRTTGFVYHAVLPSIIRHNIDLLNTLRPIRNGRHFTDDTFKCILLNENVWNLNNISLKFVPTSRINNIPSFVQIMAWCQPGDKPLSDPMIVRLPTHICVTRLQWVKHSFLTYTGIFHSMIHEYALAEYCTCCINKDSYWFVFLFKNKTSVYFIRYTYVKMCICWIAIKRKSRNSITMLLMVIFLL